MPVVCREGQYAPGRVPVTSHVCDIPARLKALIPGAFVMLNTRTQRFEIHDAAQPFTTLCCELPFDTLDARALVYVRQYHASRLDDVLREVDEHNRRLEEDALNRHLDTAGQKTKEAVAFLARRSDRDRVPDELLRA